MKHSLLSIFIVLVYLNLLNHSVKANSYCSGLIEDTYNRMASFKLDPVCHTIMNRQERILVRLTDDVPHQGTSYDSLYDNDAVRYFNSKCALNGGKCKITILISVYFQSRKIRITVGSELENLISHSNRLYIIDLMKSSLVNELYEEAFQTATSYLVKQLPTRTYVYNNVDNDDRSHNSHGTSGGSVIFAILLVFCCFGGCFWYYWNNKKEEENLLDQPSDESIHIHMQKLLDINKYKIKTMSPPITSIEICVICMEHLNPFWERDMSSGNTNSNMFLSRFFCGHYYHSSCLSAKNIHTCLMCLETQSQVSVEPCFKYYNTVSEDNIFNVIKNFDRIYPRELLGTYRNNYKNDVVIIEEHYPHYCPGTVLWIEPYPMTIMGGYQPPIVEQHYEGNTYYGNNVNDNNNYYVSNTGGDYGQPNNIVSNSGGDYGQPNNSVSNTGGDYGHNYEMKDIPTQSDVENDRGDY